MFVLFTPFSFLFSVFYLLFIFCLLFCSDFYLYWVLIECSSLLFIGLAYSYSSYGFSSLMLYFVIQALSSVNILVFYSLSMDSLLVLFLFLKLAVFPFFSWFILVVSKLNNSLFFFVSTIQNVPSIILFTSFVSSYSSSFIFYCLLFTSFTSALFMFSSYSFRVLLSFSSVGGNSWFLLSSICSLDLFFLFFLFYSISFYLLLSFMGNSFNLPFIFSYSYSIYFLLLLLSIAGFPPFPVFILKLYILYTLLSMSLFSVSIFIFFLLSVVYMLSSYLRFSTSYFINLFGCHTLSLVYAFLYSFLSTSLSISPFEDNITFKKVTPLL